jgi:Tol biopolymer transport system component
MPAPPPITTGTTIGPYEVVGWLGAGGMGEVYRARDPRLGRDVAIKLIAAAFATDAGRVRRFEQEARAAGQLNHPNILAVYDAGTNAGTPYIVSELLEGESLRHRLQQGALPPRKAIDYARQTAEGLAAAHDKNIVHRDVKPDNLFITTDGRIKILDFGIAKLTQPADDAPAHTSFATETGEGMVIGTAGYMSPEQVRGEAVDARSDIFSFGAILYEMLTGRRAFTRATTADTMVAILKEEPLEPLSAGVPPALARIVARCLEKTREMRFQSARDLAFGLELLGGTGDIAPSGAAIARLPRRELLAWTITSLALVVPAILWTLAPAPRVADAPTRVLSVVQPHGTVLATEEAPAISPDGAQLAFVGLDATGKRLLYARALDQAASPQSIAGSDGASLPFWSPTSRSIGFFAQGKLKTADVATGRIETLTDAGGARGGTWNQDDVIVFVPRPADGPHRIPASGGEATPVKIDAPQALRGWFPSFLPDGRHFLFFAPTPSQPDQAGTYVVSVDGGKPTRLLATRSAALYAVPGYLLFWRESALLAQPFDAATLVLSGSPTPVANAVGFNPVTGQTLFSVSRSGTIAFFGGAVGQTQLAWFDRNGKQIGAPGPTGTFNSVSISPDGRSVVYDEADARTGTFDLWRLDFARAVPSKLTFNPSSDIFPVWSPDGARIAFSSLRDGPPQLYVLDANSAGNETTLLKSPLPKGVSGWSGDGGLLIYTAIDPKSSGDVWALPMSGRREPFSILATSSDERYGALSPDGHWLAYVSNETGAYEVYVRAFPAPGVTRLVSTGGGLEPLWRPDGGELFYIARDQNLMAVDIRSSATAIAVTPPKALFPVRIKWLEIQAMARHYGVAADGQRFLVASATDEAQSAAITVVLNWAAVLKSR